jgi:hypothetical protein
MIKDADTEREVLEKKALKEGVCVNFKKCGNKLEDIEKAENQFSQCDDCFYKED